MIGVLDVNRDGVYRRDYGSVRPGRLGIWYRHRSSWPRRIVWDEISDWSVGTDSTGGAFSHTHALVVLWPDGYMTLRLRGPWGAIALARFREAARVHSTDSATIEGFERRQRGSAGAPTPGRWCVQA